MGERPNEDVGMLVCVAIGDQWIELFTFAD